MTELRKQIHLKASFTASKKDKKVITIIITFDVVVRKLQEKRLDKNN